MGQCQISAFEVEASVKLASEERHGSRTWLRFPGDVYVLKGALTRVDVASMREEVEAFRHHSTRHIRGPFECYDDAPNSAKMMCTYNYYSLARPTEPMPHAIMTLANSFLRDFDIVGNACLAIQYPEGAVETGLPWHTDMSGLGGPVLTMSWGGTATFLWSLTWSSWQAYRLRVEEGDVVFFDGGKLPHCVTNVLGERYNIQVRQYDASGELEGQPWDSWRKGYERVPTRYPCGSKFDSWYRLDCCPDVVGRRIRAMYVDLLKKIVRNEAAREPDRTPDADDHHLAMAEAHLASLREKFGPGLGAEDFAVYDRCLKLLGKVARGGIYAEASEAPAFSEAEAHLPKLKERFGDNVKLDVHDVYGWFIANSPMAHSLGERCQLDNTQACIEQALADNVPGDLIETGVWQGGQTILMRGVLAAHGVRDRLVYVADSFQGLPDTDVGAAPDDALACCLLEGIGKFQVTSDVVRSNFAKYDLLDDQVVVLEGWFKDTLPNAHFGCFAVIRLDGDFYESTRDALEHLYPRLSPKGYVIIDDYGVESFGCKRAVDEYRAERGITTPIRWVSGQTVYWRKPAD